MIHLQLPTNSSSSNASTEPLTPPTTPLQPQQQHQGHSSNTYRLVSSQASSIGQFHNNHFSASSISNTPQSLLPPSNSPLDVSAVAPSIEEPMRSSKLSQCQESSSIITTSTPDYYNCNGAGNISQGYWDGRPNSLPVIPAITSPIPEMHKGFIQNLTSPCDNQLVQIGSPPSKGTPSPPHTSPTSIVGHLGSNSKNSVDSSAINQHLGTETNFEGSNGGTLSNQDCYSSSYNSHHHYSPHYQYFNTYYHQGNGSYHHAGYPQHNFPHLQHSPDSVSPQLHYLHRKMNSNSTSPGSTVSTVPSLSPSSGTLGSTTATTAVSKIELSENCNIVTTPQPLPLMNASTITSNRLNGHKINDELSWAI